MSINTPAKVRQILEKYNLRPHRRLGQNFLIDQNVVDKIIKQSEIKPSDRVLEIGPGLGILTNSLSRAAKKVLAVEIDQKMAKVLENEYDWQNVILLNKDILRLKNHEIVKKLGSSGYRLIANLPYQITSEVIEKFLVHEPKPKSLIMMIQREVGVRIMSRAPRANLLALLVEFYAEPKILFRVSKNSFYPRPKIDSVIINLVPRDELPLPKDKADDFWQIVRAGYRSKRKMLINNLAAYAGIDKERLKNIWKDLGYDEKIRPENIDLEGWINIFRSLG